MTKVEETFVPVKDYEGFYEVSNLGRVRSLYRVDCRGQKRKSQIIKQVRILGYHKVSLSKDRIEKQHFVHRLVAIAFIPNTHNKPQVNHIDGNKSNNKLSNLEWCSSLENINHAINTSLRESGIGTSNPSSKLSDGEVLEIYKSIEPISKIASNFKVHRCTIYRIKSGKKWNHITNHLQSQL